MAKTKGITARTIKTPTKVPPVWQIGILFPDGKKISKPRCTLNEVMETYFIGLDNHLDKGYTAEELLEKYKETFKAKGIKVQINYLDSWGHKWTGQVAWPKDYRFLEYLNKIINNEKV